jgi:flagellum-specific peptidoglycan hydrolase FlgJ
MTAENPEHRKFLLAARDAAAKSGHIFPEIAACEAALESAYGTSQLAREGNNLFGMKAHRHMVYGILNLPTREFENGEWIQTTAAWVEYPDWASCFADRMSTLNRLAPYLHHYRDALEAKDARAFVISVSESWSTDPGWECSCGKQFSSDVLAQLHKGSLHTISQVPGLGRALKVLAVYDACAGDWNATA